MKIWSGRVISIIYQLLLVVARASGVMHEPPTLIIGVMARAKYYISSHHLALLYNSSILPNLKYCASIWGTNYSTRIDKLVILQKRALRIIDKKPYHYHTTDLLIK